MPPRRSSWAAIILLVAVVLGQSTAQQYTPLLANGESDCALLLEGPGRTSAFDYNLNALRGTFGYGGQHTCITYDAINQAYIQARKRIHVAQPKNPMWKTEEIATVGELLLDISINLAKTYGLSYEDIEKGLPLIDTTKTLIREVCPPFLANVECRPGKYRRYDGLCSNLQHPTWGATMTPFTRLVGPLYADGMTAPRISVTGNQLPLPRIVSRTVHPDEGFHDHAGTVMVVAWGQFMDHDYTLTATPLDPLNRNEPEECCHRPDHLKNPYCLEIQIPADDYFYSLFGLQCQDFVRGFPAVRPGCRLGSRSQFNTLTGVLDGNTVYGVSEKFARHLRAGYGGLMRMNPVFSEYGLKDLLPLKLDIPDEGCTRPNRSMYCFEGGEIRVNEQLVLTCMHTLMAREHNRAARGLAEVNPHWDDETLYQEARRIVIAEIQHITYNEFLPIILGKEVMEKFGLLTQKEGYWDGYDPNVNPNVIDAFAAAAFRFGHSLLPTAIERWSKAHKFIASRRLSDLIRQPYDLYRAGVLDEYFMGLMNQVAQAMDDSVTQEVTNHLFKKPGARYGMDLASFNMQRGREFGLPGYMEFRKFCGLPGANSFDELFGSMSNETIRRYASIYEHPSDVDLWSGGVSERPLPGSMVGPTFACIIATQFSYSRRGDRFWYELGNQPSSFTPEQLQEIRKAKLSRVICDNTDLIDSIQVYPMVLPDHEINPRVPCRSGVIPGIDFTKWADFGAPAAAPATPFVPITGSPPDQKPQMAPDPLQAPVQSLHSDLQQLGPPQPVQPQIQNINLKNTDMDKNCAFKPSIPPHLETPQLDVVKSIEVHSFNEQYPAETKSREQTDIIIQTNSINEIPNKNNSHLNKSENIVKRVKRAQSKITGSITQDEHVIKIYENENPVSDTQTDATNLSSEFSRPENVNSHSTSSKNTIVNKPETPPAITQELQETEKQSNVYPFHNSENLSESDTRYNTDTSSEFSPLKFSGISSYPSEETEHQNNKPESYKVANPSSAPQENIKHNTYIPSLGTTIENAHDDLEIDSHSTEGTIISYRSKPIKPYKPIEPYLTSRPNPTKLSYGHVNYDKNIKQYRPTYTSENYNSKSSEELTPYPAEDSEEIEKYQYSSTKSSNVPKDISTYNDNVQTTIAPSRNKNPKNLEENKYVIEDSGEIENQYTENKSNKNSKVLNTLSKRSRLESDDYPYNSHSIYKEAETPNHGKFTAEESYPHIGLTKTEKPTNLWEEGSTLEDNAKETEKESSYHSEVSSEIENIDFNHDNVSTSTKPSYVSQHSNEGIDSEYKNTRPYSAKKHKPSEQSVRYDTQANANSSPEDSEEIHSEYRGSKPNSVLKHRREHDQSARYDTKANSNSNTDDSEEVYYEHKDVKPFSSSNNTKVSDQTVGYHAELNPNSFSEDSAETEEQSEEYDPYRDSASTTKLKDNREKFNSHYSNSNNNHRKPKYVVSSYSGEDSEESETPYNIEKSTEGPEKNSKYRKIVNENQYSSPMENKQSSDAALPFHSEDFEHNDKYSTQDSISQTKSIPEQNIRYDTNTGPYSIPPAVSNSKRSDVGNKYHNKNLETEEHYEEPEEHRSSRFREIPEGNMEHGTVLKPTHLHSKHMHMRRPDAQTLYSDSEEIYMTENESNSQKKLKFTIPSDEKPGYKNENSYNYRKTPGDKKSNSAENSEEIKIYDQESVIEGDKDPKPAELSEEKAKYNTHVNPNYMPFENKASNKPNIYPFEDSREIEVSHKESGQYASLEFKEGPLESKTHNSNVRPKFSSIDNDQARLSNSDSQYPVEESEEHYKEANSHQKNETEETHKSNSNLDFRSLGTEHGKISDYIIKHPFSETEETEERSKGNGFYTAPKSTRVSEERIKNSSEINPNTFHLVSKVTNKPQVITSSEEATVYKSYESLKVPAETVQKSNDNDNKDTTFANSKGGKHKSKKTTPRERKNIKMYQVYEDSDDILPDDLGLGIADFNKYYGNSNFRNKKHEINEPTIVSTISPTKVADLTEKAKIEASSEEDDEIPKYIPSWKHQQNSSNIRNQTLESKDPLTVHTTQQTKLNFADTMSDVDKEIGSSEDDYDYEGAEFIPSWDSDYHDSSNDNNRKYETKEDTRTTLVSNMTDKKDNERVENSSTDDYGSVEYDSREKRNEEQNIRDLSGNSKKRTPNKFDNGASQNEELERVSQDPYTQYKLPEESSADSSRSSFLTRGDSSTENEDEIKLPKEGSGKSHVRQYSESRFDVKDDDEKEGSMSVTPKETLENEKQSRPTKLQNEETQSHNNKPEEENKDDAPVEESQEESLYDTLSKIIEKKDAISRSEEVVPKGTNNTGKKKEAESYNNYWVLEYSRPRRNVDNNPEERKVEESFHDTLSKIIEKKDAISRNEEVVPVGTDSSGKKKEAESYNNYWVLEYSRPRRNTENILDEEKLEENLHDTLSKIIEKKDAISRNEEVVPVGTDSSGKKKEAETYNNYWVLEYSRPRRNVDNNPEEGKVEESFHDTLSKIIEKKDAISRNEEVVPVGTDSSGKKKEADSYNNYWVLEYSRPRRNTENSPDEEKLEENLHDTLSKIIEKKDAISRNEEVVPVGTDSSGKKKEAESYNNYWVLEYSRPRRNTENTPDEEN